jgi:septal ring factor EnvC (AmiA/AmiB activator)
LAEIRRLKVELERLRLDTREARERRSRPDPRVQRLEAENSRLRDELFRARADRDELEEGLREAVDRLRRA